MSDDVGGGLWPRLVRLLSGPSMPESGAGRKSQRLHGRRTNSRRIFSARIREERAPGGNVMGLPRSDLPSFPRHSWDHVSERGCAGFPKVTKGLSSFHVETNSSLDELAPRRSSPGLGHPG